MNHLVTIVLRAGRTAFSLLAQFNAGEAHPTADSSPETVAAGLAATAEVMQRNATMTHLAAQRAALVAAGAAPQYQLTLRALLVSRSC